MSQMECIAPHAYTEDVGLRAAMDMKIPTFTPSASPAPHDTPNPPHAPDALDALNRSMFTIFTTPVMQVIPFTRDPFDRLNSLVLSNKTKPIALFPSDAGLQKQGSIKPAPIGRGTNMSCMLIDPERTPDFYCVVVTEENDCYRAEILDGPLYVSAMCMPAHTCSSVITPYEHRISGRIGPSETATLHKLRRGLLAMDSTIFANVAPAFLFDGDAGAESMHLSNPFSINKFRGTLYMNNIPDGVVVFGDQSSHTYLHIDEVMLTLKNFAARFRNVPANEEHLYTFQVVARHLERASAAEKYSISQEEILLSLSFPDNLHIEIGRAVFASASPEAREAYMKHQMNPEYYGFEFGSSEEALAMLYEHVDHSNERRYYGHRSLIIQYLVRMLKHKCLGNSNSRWVLTAVIYGRK